MMQPVLAKGFCGWAVAVDGNAQLGCFEIRDAFGAFSAAGSALSEGHGHAMLAEAYWHSGDAERGLLSLDEPLTSTKSEERNFAAELYRWRGELLLMDARAKAIDSSVEAESLFQEAIDIARKQSAKSLELRAATSLARLLINQGRRQIARVMLAEIYNWFTEGFDTADLKDAKALLDELSQQV
jgi:predicted ATPase